MSSSGVYVGGRRGRRLLTTTQVLRGSRVEWRVRSKGLLAGAGSVSAAASTVGSACGVVRVSLGVASLVHPARPSAATSSQAARTGSGLLDPSGRHRQVERRQRG